MFVLVYFLGGDFLGVFIDNILSGNIQELLGDLYQDTISQIVVLWSVLPLAGIILLFVLLVVQLFAGKR